jgi:hypothetical protein
MSDEKQQGISQGIMRGQNHTFLSGDGTKYVTFANRNTAIANILALCPNVAQ